MTAVRKTASEKKHDENSKFPLKLSMRVSENAHAGFNSWYKANEGSFGSVAHAFRALLDVLPASSSPLTAAQVKDVYAAANTVRATDSNPTSRWNSSKGMTSILRLRPAVTDAQHVKFSAVISQLTAYCQSNDTATLSDGAITYGLMKVVGAAAVKLAANESAAEKKNSAAAKKPAAPKKTAKATAAKMSATAPAAESSVCSTGSSLVDRTSDEDGDAMDDMD